jgi:uncharacterized membrane protein (DUF106 family)
MVRKEPNKTQLLLIAVIVNVLVLSLLVGISLGIIHVFLQGKVDKTLIPVFGMIFFMGSVITTGLVYRFYMRRFVGREQLDEILNRSKHKHKPGDKA